MRESTLWHSTTERSELAGGRPVVNDRPMPDCYHVVASDPAETGKDISDAVAAVGGPGRLDKLSLNRDKDRVHSRVHYETMELASEYFDVLTSELERRGHTIHYADVIEDFEELGLSFEGYPPETGA